MNPGNNEPRHDAGAGGRRKSAVVGASPIVPQPTDIPQQGRRAAGDPLPLGNGSPALSARPLVLITRGRVEFTAKCPGCDNWHRHRKLGDVRGPCGTTYELQPRRGRARGK